MHVFVTGGSGLTGPAIVTELIAAGHTVTALARSDTSAAKLDGLGATPLRGSIEDLDSLRRGAEQADGVIHMAVGGAGLDETTRLDTAANTAIGQALVGSRKPFVSTSGTFVMRPGRVSTESDTPDPGALAAYRIPGEQACLGFAGQGVRSSVVRLSPTVHGPGDYGFVAMLVATARKTGISAYIGDGSNRWPAIHRLDAAMLFRLALETAPAGSPLHGVGESAVTLKSVAEQIGRILGLPVRSLTPDEAGSHFGSPALASVVAADSPASSAHTQQLLGWSPTHPTLLEDLRTGDYFASNPDRALEVLNTATGAS